jgi:DNA-binding GntR family transcriptional regulator
MNSKPKAPLSPKEPISLPDDGTEPPTADEVIHDEFVRALMAGDAATAAKALRKGVLQWKTHLSSLLVGHPRQKA